MTLLAPRRSLGRVPFNATQLGIGDVADRKSDAARLVTLLRRALDHGLNLIDTAPMYEDGFSEELVGHALQGVARDKVFLVDKIDRLKENVAEQLEASLRRLRQSHVDLVVFHNVSTMEDWREITAPRRGMEQLKACVTRGMCRFVGISSHHPDVLNAALDGKQCDVVMFPVGPFVDERYVKEILPRCQREGVGTIGFKTFGAGKLVADTEGYNQPLPGSQRDLPRISVEECVHYTLTLDPDVTLLGMSSEQEQDAVFEAFKRFKPLGDDGMARIRERAAAAIKGKGNVWWNP